MNVDLYTINHTYLHDVGAVLVAPSGSALLLVEGAADGPATDLGLRFDDAAPTRVPGGTRPATGGIFKPTATSSFMAPFPFPAPGPGSSYGHPGPAIGGTATLSSAFDGQAADGVWSLFLRDFAPSDTGSVDNGWALDIETTAPQPKPAARRSGSARRRRRRSARRGRQPRGSARRGDRGTSGGRRPVPAGSGFPRVASR